ncbi:hypothetical protein M8J75_003280 [Diaphorina citri]|nr:hypothetical protein M8J75_003280 [Diaphorina citri]
MFWFLLFQIGLYDMLNVSASNSNKTASDKLYRLDKIKWVSSWFRRKKSAEENNTYCVKISSDDLDTHIADSQQPHLSRISSMCLSVGDVLVTSPLPCPVSPAISQRPLRDLDSDMQTLRMSRQDNPFLQLLASRESLANSVEENESDDVTLMSQELGGELDPLTLPEIHQHMVRSPPPTSWPRSPAFRFDSSQESLGMRSPRHDAIRSPVSHNEPCLLSPRLSLPSKYRSRDSSRERTGGSFSLLTPTAPLRSLSEVRRHHSKSTEESEQLVAPSSIQ